MNDGRNLTDIRDELACMLSQRLDSHPHIEPLNISPWLAMSLMQKSIRRDRSDMALAAAATLLRDSPERLWRRICVTAFEDIGAGDVDTVCAVIAGLKGKLWRAKVGGEWAVARQLIQLMCKAPKCRGADDLAMVCEAHPELESQRQTYALQSSDWLLEKALYGSALPERALALWFAFGTHRCRSDSLLQRRSDYQGLLRELPSHGIDPLLVEIVEDGLKKGGGILAPFFMLLASMRPEEEPSLSDDIYPEELMIGSVPGWALDMHVREGNTAMRRFLEQRCETVRWLAQYAPGAKQGKLLKYLVFGVESGLVARRNRWDVGDRLRDMSEFECLGIAAQDARDAQRLLRADIPILNEMRFHTLQGKV